MTGPDLTRSRTTRTALARLPGRTAPAAVRKVRIRIRRGMLSVMMIAAALLVALPLYYIGVNTFKTPVEMSQSPLGLPTQPTLDNYVNVFATTPVVRAFLNTLYVTVLGVGIQVFIGSLAAYGMIMRRDRLTAALGTILMIAFVIPGQATLIPLFRLGATTGLVDSLSGLVIMYLAGSVFCYFLIVGYMRKIPWEIVEAARIDGAGPFLIYWRIVLPLIRPILITVTVFQTMWVWNDFITPNVFISSSQNRTLVLQVYNAVGQFSTDWPAFMTLTVVSLIPIFIFFVVCQRWIVAGLAAGGVKA